MVVEGEEVRALAEMLLNGASLDQSYTGDEEALAKHPACRSARPSAAQAPKGGDDS